MSQTSDELLAELCSILEYAIDVGDYPGVETVTRTRYNGVTSIPHIDVVWDRRIIRVHADDLGPVEDISAAVGHEIDVDGMDQSTIDSINAFIAGRGAEL